MSYYIMLCKPTLRPRTAEAPLVLLHIYIYMHIYIYIHIYTGCRGPADPAADHPDGLDPEEVRPGPAADALPGRPIY